MAGNIRPFQGRRYGEAFTPGFRLGLLILGLSKARAAFYFTASYVYIACKAMLMADSLWAMLNAEFKMLNYLENYRKH